MNMDISNFLLFINITSFFICGFDKYLAKNKKYRVSEKILLGMCFIGGIFGFYLGSKIFRHKTKDKKFIIFMYPILIFWIFILISIILW